MAMHPAPAILNGLPIYWSGVDDATPDGCTLIVATYLGILTTYIVRGGNVIGRIEVHRNHSAGYVGDRLKGGTLVGLGDSQKLVAKIAAHDATITD